MVARNRLPLRRQRGIREGGGASSTRRSAGNQRHSNAAEQGDSMRTTRVLVLHPHRIVAEAVARRLDAEPEIRTVELCATAPAVQSAVNALAPDVAVIQHEAEDRSVLELTAWLVEHDPPVGVVAVLGNDDTQAAAIRVIRAGAAAVLTKDSPTSDLVEAVVSVAMKHAFVSRHLLRAVLWELRSSTPVPNEYDERLGRLTPREREVLQYLVAGYGRATMAETMTLSIDTVRTHTRNILAKLEVHSSLEAVSVARRATRRTWNIGRARAEAHG